MTIDYEKALDRFEKAAKKVYLTFKATNPQTRMTFEDAHLILSEFLDRLWDPTKTLYTEQNGYSLVDVMVKHVKTFGLSRLVREHKANNEFRHTDI